MAEPTLCHEEVSRRGEAQPCDQPALTTHRHTESGTYPVCATHDRTGTARRALFVGARPDLVDVGTTGQVTALAVMSA